MATARISARDERNAVRDIALSLHAGLAEIEHERSIVTRSFSEAVLRSNADFDTKERGLSRPKVSAIAIILLNNDSGPIPIMRMAFWQLTAPVPRLAPPLPNDAYAKGLAELEAAKLVEKDPLTGTFALTDIGMLVFEAMQSKVSAEWRTAIGRRD